MKRIRRILVGSLASLLATGLRGGLWAQQEEIGKTVAELEKNMAFAFAKAVALSAVLAPNMNGFIEAARTGRGTPTGADFGSFMPRPILGVSGETREEAMRKFSELELMKGRGVGVVIQRKDGWTAGKVIESLDGVIKEKEEGSDIQKATQWVILENAPAGNSPKLFQRLEKLHQIDVLVVFLYYPDKNGS